MMKYFLVLLVSTENIKQHLLKASIWRSAGPNWLVTDAFKKAARESCRPLLNVSRTLDNQQIAILLTIKKGKQITRDNYSTLSLVPTQEKQLECYYGFIFNHTKMARIVINTNHHRIRQTQVLLNKVYFSILSQMSQCQCNKCRHLQVAELVCDTPVLLAQNWISAFNLRCIKN